MFTKFNAGQMKGVVQRNPKLPTPTTKTTVVIVFFWLPCERLLHHTEKTQEFVSCHTSNVSKCPERLKEKVPLNLPHPGEKNTSKQGPKKNTQNLHPEKKRLETQN